MGVRVKEAKGANPSITVGNFFIQLQYVIPQLTPLDSPCLPSRFTILRHKEVGRKTKQQQPQQQEKRMKNIVLARRYTFTLNFVYCNTWTSTLTLWSGKLKKKRKYQFILLNGTSLIKKRKLNDMKKKSHFCYGKVTSKQPTKRTIIHTF